METFTQYDVILLFWADDDNRCEFTIDNIIIRKRRATLFRNPEETD